MADKWTDSPDSKTVKGRLKSTFRDPDTDGSYTRAFMSGAVKGATLPVTTGNGKTLPVGGLAFLAATTICGGLMGANITGTKDVDRDTVYSPLPIETVLSGDIRDGVGHVGVRVNLDGENRQYVLTKDENGYVLYSLLSYSLYRSDWQMIMLDSIEDSAYTSQRIAQILNGYAANLNDIDTDLSEQGRPKMFTVKDMSILYDAHPSPERVSIGREAQGIGSSPIQAGQDVSDQFSALAAVWTDAARAFEGGQLSVPSELPEKESQIVETITYDYAAFDSAKTAYLSYLAFHALWLLGGGVAGVSRHNTRRNKNNTGQKSQTDESATPPKPAAPTPTPKPS